MTKRFKRLKTKRQLVEKQPSTNIIAEGDSDAQASAKEQFPCPFQACGKRFRISLGKNMRKHLEQRHEWSLAATANDHQLPPEVAAALAALKELQAACLLTDDKKHR